MEKFDWVVVANGSQARILERSKTETHVWKELACLVHPATRANGNDPHGNTAGHTISGRRGLAPRQEAKDHHRQIFCKQIAEKIEEGTSSNRIEGIVIFASASMLGELLKQLDDGTKKLIVSTHHKDLTSLSTAELMVQFHQEFDL
jgi:protein required for attachment to host cells